MKRFWRVAEAVEADGGFAIALDGRRVRTPARADLIVAAPALAAAVAAEWSAAGETVDPRAMPLTGLANAALDHVAADRARFAAGLARYGEADLLYYRAEGPPALVTMQATAWDPLLDWARTRFGIRFVIGGGIRHLAQPQATIDALAGAVAGLDPFRLAGLSPLVTIGGSLVTALAVVESTITLDTAWQALTVDERWQATHWGADAEAEATLDARRRDFIAGARFISLLD